MRRLSTLLLVALPLLARAQTAGQVTFSNSPINTDECNAGAATSVTLGWFLTLESGAILPSTGGELHVYATSTPPTSNYCNVPPADGVGQLGATITNPTVRTGSSTVTVADLLNATKFTCSVSNAVKTIHVCVHYVVSGTNKGYAKGSADLDTRVPTAPTVSPPVLPDERALYVTMLPGAVGDVAADHFRASATGPDTVEHFSGDTAAGAKVRIGGLENGVEYAIKAYAYSKAGNRSVATDYTPASPAEVTPVNVRDFWEYYRDAAGGRDSGGCQAGGAGLLALLAAASLLRLGRRP